ncbi:MAG: aminotransferase class V-fold PLP-dependent enzyme [Sulfolobaceae archaeon]
MKIYNKKVYLASCSHSPVYKEMIDAIEEYKRDLIEYGNPWELWMEKVNEAKKLFASLINAKESEITIHFSVSSALSALLSSFNYSRRNKIITNDLEFPTSNYIFLAQRKLGAKIITLKSLNYKVTSDMYKDFIDDTTKLVSSYYVSPLSGHKQDLKSLVEISHEKGAEVYIDAYQAIGYIQTDVRKLDIDYMTTGASKWLLGWPGVAFLYIREDLIHQLEPICIGWLSQKNPFEFGAQNLEYLDTADRFQSGTWTIPSIYVAIAGLKIILNENQSVIEEKVKKLAKYAIELIIEKGLKIITPIEENERGAIISIKVKNPYKLEKIANKEGIALSSRGSFIRICPHFFNTYHDIENAINMIYKLKDVD